MGSDPNAMSSGRRLTTAFRKERQCSERQEWAHSCRAQFGSAAERKLMLGFVFPTNVPSWLGPRAKHHALARS
jgi:hypothetical protein